ncbi:hypothetical protein CWR41_02025 [Cedecea lapagei]|nr:hypothetical protein CWR41_02025 [Cedecea lapagei]
MSFVTKYRYQPSLLLANSENLFYHSKNQVGLPPTSRDPGYAYFRSRRAIRPLFLTLTLEVNNETDSPGDC